MESFLIILKFVVERNNPRAFLAPSCCARATALYLVVPALGIVSLAELSLVMLSVPELVVAAFFLAAVVFFLAFFFFAFLGSAVPVDFMLSVVALALASVLASVLAAGAAGVAAGAGVGVWAAAVNDTAKAPASSADINLVIFILDLVGQK